MKDFDAIPVVEIYRGVGLHDQQLRIAGQSDEPQAVDPGLAEIPAEGVEIHAAEASAIEGYVGDDGEDISMEEVLGRGKRVASEPAAPAVKPQPVETPAV